MGGWRLSAQDDVDFSFYWSNHQSKCVVRLCETSESRGAMLILLLELIFAKYRSSLRKAVNKSTYQILGQLDNCKDSCAYKKMPSRHAEKWDACR